MTSTVPRLLPPRRRLHRAIGARLSAALRCRRSRDATSALVGVLVLALPPAGAQPIAAPADDITHRVQACVACHGEADRATPHGYFPRIAGKPAGYLHQQLLNFRDGRRRHALMSGLVQHLSDTYLREIAEHFAALDLPHRPLPPVVAAPALLASGEALVRRGDPARELPACASCHGEVLLGVTPALPGLLGLPRDYLNAQLGQWRAGQRHAAPPDCMARIATRLSPQDIVAVSTWLAAQPVPPGARPASTLPAPLPLPCGSVDAARRAAGTGGQDGRGAASARDGAGAAAEAAGAAGGLGLREAATVPGQLDAGPATAADGEGGRPATSGSRR